MKDEDASPRLKYLPCGGVVSTVFVYKETSVQNAANSVYAHKSTIDGENLARGSKKVYTFKTDAERMQYIIGRIGTVPGASGY